jgi:hypothetical protein
MAGADLQLTLEWMHLAIQSQFENRANLATD